MVSKSSPAASASSVYPAPGEIRVVQDGVRDENITTEYRADESGGWIWHASYALEAAIVDAVGPQCDLTSKRVLELGSGTGWLALRLAQRGCLVTATDRAGAIPRILRNVLKNQQRFGFSPEGEQLLQVECCALDWEAASSTATLPFKKN